MLKRKELLADVPVCASVKTLVRRITDTHTYSPIGNNTVARKYNMSQ